MAKNWAIAIGINNYRFLQPLNYAKRDADAMRQFLMNEAGFDQVFFFSDDSPPINGKSTEPFCSNILRVLRQVFKTPFMGDGDNFWFFFSGHGIRHNERDYLMPLDGDPEDVERTGISTTYITEQLRRCGADNVVMILDACRSEGRKSGVGVGQQTEQEARQTGVVSIFSCSPDQYSYEIDAIQHGAFTAALIEGLGVRGRCATVERLNQYLENRVPEIIRQHFRRARQVPYAIAEPISRASLILMPQHATLTDIATLKNNAYRAQTKEDWELAQQLWIRVLASASGQDMDAIEALQAIAVRKQSSQVSQKVDFLSDLEPKVSATLTSKAPENKPSDADKTALNTFTNQLDKNPQSVHFLPSDPKRLSSKEHSNKLNELPEIIKAESVFQGGIYSALERALSQKDWKNADQQTYLIIVKLLNCERKGWIDIYDAVSTPSIATSIRHIDRLWLFFSESQFGFGAQKKIWQDLCHGEYSIKNEKLLSEIFGWSVSGKWLSYEDLDFSSKAPRGHLPWHGDGLAWFSVGWFVWTGGCSNFSISKLEKMHNLLRTI